MSFGYKQYLLLLCPPVLVISTFYLFRFLDTNFGRQKAYLFGFLFYWIVWCFFLPIITVGLAGIGEMFNKPDPIFGKPGWLGLLLLAGPPLLMYLTKFFPSITGTTATFIIASLIFALLNGTFEEILWRGSYIVAFEGNLFWGYLYPAIWFGLWHISPQVVDAGSVTVDTLQFALISILLGLVWGWVAKTSGSIRWTVLAHILLNFAAPAGGWFIYTFK